MRRLILVITALITTNTFLAQDFSGFPMEDGNLKFTGVVEIEGKAKKEIRELSKLWVSESFKNQAHANDEKTKKGILKKDDGFTTYKDIVQVDSENIFVVIGLTERFKKKGFYINHFAKFVLKLEFKDNKFRYSMYDFKYVFPFIGTGVISEPDFEDYMRFHKGHWKKIKDDAFSKISNIPQSLEDYINNANNDW